MVKGTAKVLTWKNIIKLIILTSLVVGVYMFNTTLIALLTDPTAGELERSQNENEIQPWDDVTKVELTFDPSAYIEALLNSDLLNNMSLEEQLELMENMFGDGIEDYLAQSELTPNEFFDTYDDELATLLDSLAGDSFSGDLLDQFNDPALVAVLIAKPMFFAAGNNPANPWNDQQDTLFKAKAFDQYDLVNFDWTEGSIGGSGTLIPDPDSSDQKFHLKVPVVITDQTVTTLFTNSPHPRILQDSLQVSPISPTSDPSLKSQSYLGGAWAESSFSLQDMTQMTNFSYDLLYNDNDYPSASYYNGLNLEMTDYTALDTEVEGCLTGPFDGTNTITWTQYRATHPNFASVASQLESYIGFTSATTTYQKMQAITDFVGTNFVYNPLGDARPPEGEDPLEWFCQSGESQYPFEFSSLTVALARLKGISARYVTGYKYNDLLSESLGISSFYDSTDGMTYYPYLVGNIYTWVEAFIPTSDTTGDWVPFDNHFTATPQIPQSPDDVQFILTYNDGGFYPDIAGYERVDDFGANQSVDITLTYKFNDDPMGSQLINLYDVTYDQPLDFGYTDANGQITFSLDLNQLTVGPHTLNITTEYYGVPIFNITVVNVLGEVEIYSNVSNSIIVSGPNTPQTQGISGYAYDPVTHRNVANAELNFTGVKLATINEPIPQSFDVSPNSVVTGSSGTFSTSVSIPGFISADWGSQYEIFTNFLGVFDISADIAKFSPAFQTYFSSFPTRLPAHLAAGYTDSKNETFLMYNDNYYEYHFYLNTTRYSHNSSTPTYQDSLIYGSRSNLVLNFSASLWQGYNYSSGATIQIFDESEGNRLVTSFTTNSFGYGSILHDISSDAATDWTAGPHLLRMEWLGAPNTAETYFYIFIEEPVVVDQLSEVFNGGTGGLPSKTNVYFLNNELGDPYDNFTVYGCIYDAITGENLSNYVIHYRLFDRLGLPHNVSFLQQGVFSEEVTNPALGFSEKFNFFNFSAPSYDPFRTDVYFNGFFNLSGHGWNNSWNGLWMPYFQALPTSNDSSDGTLEVINPSTYTFDTYLNNQLISTWNATTTVSERQFGILDSLNFTAYFKDQGTPLSGANVTLIDINSSAVWMGQTDAQGKIEFVFNFGPGNITGVNSFLFNVSYDDGLIVNINSTHFYVFFNETKSYNFDSQLNFTSFDSLAPYLTRQLGVSDFFQLSGVFEYVNGTKIMGAPINITDESDPTVTRQILTDASGYYNWTLGFGFANKTGLHRYNLSVNLSQGSYSVYISHIIEVYFNETLNFAFTGYMNSTDFNTLGIIQADSGNTLLIDGEFLLKGSGFQSATVTLTDGLNGTSWLLSTDVSGYVNFTVFFGSNIQTGLRVYNLSVKYVGSAFTIQMQRDLSVNFDPANFFSLTPWDNVTGETVDSGDQMHVTLKVLRGASDFDSGIATLTDTLNGSSSWLDNTIINGNFSFLVTFGSGLRVGTHSYLLNYTYTDPYGYYYEYTYTISNVNFDPLAFYVFNQFNNNTPIVSGGQTVHFDTVFQHNGMAPENPAVVKLIDFANRSMDQNQGVDGSGNSQFDLYFGKGIVTGDHSITLLVNYTDQYGYEIYFEYTNIIIHFQPTEGYRFRPWMNITDNSWVGLDEPFHISGIFDYNGTGSFVPVSGANITLTDLTEGSTLNSIITTGTGQGNFTVEFAASGYILGWHDFKINVSYTDGAGYLVYFTHTYHIYFSPKGYTFDPWDSTGGATVGTDDIIDISATFAHYGSPISGETVRLIDQTDPSIDVTDITDGSGYANFTIGFAPGNITGWHNFSLSITYVDAYGYTIVNQTNVLIFFDYNKNYQLLYTDNIVGSVGSDDTVDINVRFLSKTNPVAGVVIILKDPGSATLATGITDGSGWANFTLSFGPSNYTGLQTYTINASYDGITFVVNKQDTFDVNFDYTQNYHLDITDDDTGLQYGAGDSLQLNSQFLSLTNPVSGASITITDSVEGLLHSGTTDGNGWVNYTVNFGPGWNPGAHVITVAVSFDGITYTYSDSFIYNIDFNETKNYIYSPYDTIGGMTQTFGDSVEISCAFTLKGAGIGGAAVTLTDLSNGTTWSSSTNGNGYANFTISFNANVYPGGHHYQLDLTYDGTSYIITKQSDHWIFYKNPLNISAAISDYSSNMTLDQVVPFTFHVTGNLVDSSNIAHGHLDALLSVYIYEGITDVSDLFTYSMVINYYHDNSDGAYDISLSITNAPYRGQFTVIVGFNGSLDVDLGSVGYTPDALPVNSTSDNVYAYFWVYQNTTIEWDYTIDNSELPYPLNQQSGLIIDGSDVTIFGNLSDSDGIRLANQNLTIILYDKSGNELDQFNVTTDAQGHFELLIEDCPYDLDEILIIFDGNTVLFLNDISEGGSIS
ncbi:MAG: transglutaminase domain-containing protein [Promethearchaeota archaeon]